MDSSSTSCMGSVRQLVRYGNIYPARSTLTFECRVEQETPRSDDEVPAECYQEDLVVSIAATTANTLDSKPHKQQVGQGVNDLSGVDGSIVVLPREALR